MTQPTARQSARGPALARNVEIRRAYAVEEWVVVVSTRTHMNKHVWYECKCNNTGCQFCDGGLGWCTVCDGFEGTLTTECPGRKITQEEADKIYNWKSLDFIGGEWVEKKAA